MIACVRILAGLGFLAAGVLKLLDEAFLYGGLLHHLTDIGQPYSFYLPIVNRFVELNQTLFAFATALGEILVGLSLLLGMFVSVGALGGIFLLLNFALATSSGQPTRLAWHVALALLLLLLGRMGAGLKWGVDAWLVRRLKDWLVLFPLRWKAPQIE